MSERSGIEIDYCPECRGVWLDRGELDKILDRAGRDQSGSAQSSAPARSSTSTHREYGSRNNYRPKKKEHWLGELFG